MLAAALGLAACAIGSEPSISTEELAGRIESGTAPVVVDVRSDSEYRESHVPGAVHIPFLDVDERAGELELEPGETVVVYCAHGPRAAWARRSFAAAGIHDVVYLQGHMTAWLDEGRPVESGAAASP
jgi:rhodanese-related sulfurtransferase